jgi:hypothetical protein
MGRVALAHEDLAEFRAWESHVSEFVDGLQVRPNLTFTRPQFYRHVAEMRFFGAQGGDVQAADDLHTMLDAGGTEALNAVLNLCAQHDVIPDLWIDQHTTTDEERAAAWQTYTFRKRYNAERVGDKMPVAELRRPGAVRYMQNYIDGNLSNDQTLAFGTNVFHLAEDGVEKRQIVSRFGITLDAIIHEADEHDEYLSNEELRHSMGMVELIAKDNNDIHAETVLDIAAVVEREASAVGKQPSLLRAQARMAVAVAVLRGMDIADIDTDLIPDLIKFENNPYNHDELRDTLLRVAAETYAGRGDSSMATFTMAMIRNTREWQSAFNAYMLAGGDAEQAIQADAMRSSIEQVMGSTYEAKTGLSSNQEWAVRRMYAEYAAGISIEDYVAAGQAVVRMAQSIGSYGTDADTPRVDDQMFWDSLHRLMDHHPESVSIASSVIAALDKNTRFGYRSQVLELFSAYGSREARATNWEHVQHSPFSRDIYIAQYAGAALAAVGVKK